MNISILHAQLILQTLSNFRRIAVLIIARGFVVCLAFASAARSGSAQESTFRYAVVAADHQAASEAGAKILRQGGNVVDAAVATSFALSVVRPASCGIGGGGFMVFWDAKQQKSIAVDYLERAPAAATADRFSSGDASEPPSVRGGLASGIPGNVAGLCYMAEKFGTLPISVLIQPTIELFRDGVEVDANDMEVQSSTLGTLEKHPGYRERFSLLRNQYLNDGRHWKRGDRFHSPQLKVLEAIAAHGAAGFYQGPVAEAIAATAVK